MKKLLFICLCGCCMFMTFANRKPVIWVLGDSTVCNFTNDAAHRVGWAQMLPNYLIKDSVEVHNKAISGRSSKDFITYQNGWNSFKDSISAGDYVIIEFGHNDENKDDTARETLPGSTFEKYLSIYIDYALSVGAIPILATPIERDEWANNVIEPSHIKPYGDYPQAIRNLAQAKNIALVDMTNLTTAFYQSIGKDSTTKLFVFNDATHIVEAGAIQIAKLFVNDIAVQGLKPISKWVKDVSFRKQGLLHSGVKQCDRIACQSNGFFRIISYDKIEELFVFSLNGKIINTKCKIAGDNTLHINSPSGQILSSGKYVIRYTLNTGVKRVISVEIN